MTSERLTTDQCLLLQRFFDGEADAEQQAEARRLLEASAAARVFLAALEELFQAVRAAADEAWSQITPPPADLVAELAATSGALSEATLEELAPLLERFHDGEVDEAEAAFVIALLEERPDAADYLSSLDVIRDGMRSAGEEILGEIDFGGFWNSLEPRLDAEDAESFDPEEHTVLLYRYHDGEVTDAERDLVDAWVKAGHPEVLDTLGALAELYVAVNASVEYAQEQVELTDLWTGVEQALDEAPAPGAEQAPEQGTVVSLAQARQQRDEQPSEDKRGVRFNLQAIFALAAALALIFLGAVIGQRFLGGEQVIIKEKTVVIVDSVEYAPGASVMINSPMQPASLEAPADGEEEPTIIWLFDDSPTAGGEPSGEEAPEAQPDDEATRRNGPI